MTNKALVECICILDESGSMYSLVNDVIGGYNKLIDDQKAIPGDANFTLVKFNTQAKTVYENMPIGLVQLLTEKDYTPGGATALLDTVGDVITRIGTRLAGTPEDQRPNKVIIAIMTDGEENSSSRYTKAQVKEMIETQQNKYQWEFLFVGAGIDAFTDASALGISAANTKQVLHSSAGMGQTFSAMNRSYSSARTP